MKGYCELCGEYSKRLVPVIIDGVIYRVCEKCAVGHKRVPEHLVRRKKKKVRPATKRKKEPVEEYEEYVIQNAGEVIRRAREKKGLTREQLAPLVGERTGTIARIERGEWIPPIPIAKKFERVLGIKLVEKETITEHEERKENHEFYLTIGDVAEFRD